MCPGESEHRRMVAEPLHVGGAAAGAGRVGRTAVARSHERAFGCLPRAQPQSRRLPANPTACCCCCASFFFILLRLFSCNVFWNVLIPDVFVNRVCGQGREKKAGRVSGGNKKRARSCALWPCMHLHFNSAKAVTARRCCAGAWSMSHTGNCMAVTQTLQWQPDVQNCTPYKQPR